MTFQYSKDQIMGRKKRNGVPVLFISADRGK